MLLRFFIFSFFSFFIFSSFAQAPKTYSSADILQQIKKLEEFGSVLYIAAHPDDENTRLLAYLANEKKYRTGYLSLTRGDGGQNLIGDEQGIELGLIRTQELLSARRIDGAEQYFTRAYDFGYSKNPEEALRIWGHDKILADIVFAIRKFKPDVIITRFPTTGEGGHGHHTASAILAGEAFEAAADKNKFSEQLKYVTVWQAKRLLWNTFNFGGNNTTKEDQFKIDCGVYNPILGKNYGEIAAESRSRHKSQGFGVPAQRGKNIEYFTTIKGEPVQKDLIDGIDSNILKTERASQYFATVKEIINSYNPNAPELSIKKLITLKNIASNWEYVSQQKKDDIEKLIANSAGLFFEAISINQLNTIGDSMKIKYSFINRSNAIVEEVRVQCIDAKIIWKDITQNELSEKTTTEFLSTNRKVTQPHFLESPKSIGAYTIEDPLEISAPEIKRLTATFQIKIEGTNIGFEVPVQYKYTDPVKGELYEPIQIVYPAFINVTPNLLIFSNNKREEKKLQFAIKANIPLKEKIKLFTLENSKSTLIKDTMLSLEKFDKVNINTTLKSINFSNDSSYNIGSELVVPSFFEHQYASLKKISYDHIPDIFYNYQDKVKVIKMDLETVGSEAGYIVGAGDKVPQALEQMGYNVTLLTEKDITIDNIKKFDVIITGVRAYNIHSWLSNVYPTLMQYVKDGGTLLTQYNTNNQIGPVKASIAPYPFTISRNRITDETAAVNFLLPNDPALNFPNTITAKDFDGWVQERSIYNAEKTDTAYKKILSMKDPGEGLQDGSLIIADFGKGRYIYTGLVFFRELPAGVAGSYRLFANLIANRKYK